MNEKDLLNKTINGFLWVFFGNGIKTVSKLVFLIIMARLLFPEDFGLVASLGIIISLMEVINRAGIAPSLINIKELNKNHISTGFSLSLILGVLLYIFVYSLAPIFQNFLNANEEFILAIRVMGVLFIINGISRVSDGMLQRNLNFKRINLIQIISMVIGYTLVGLILGFLGFGYWALIIAEMTKKTLNTILLFISYKHSLSVKIKRKEFKEILSYGGGFTLGTLIDYLANRGDEIIIARVLGTISLGYYTRAFQLMSVPVEILNQIFEKVLFPVMSKIKDNPKKLADIYLKNISFIFLISLPFSLYLFLLSSEIIRAVLGPNWEEAIGVLKVLAIGMVFRSGYKVSESLANASGAVYKKAGRQAIFVTFIFIFGWIGHYWGLVGISSGILLAFILNFLIMQYLTITLVPLSFSDILKSILPSIILTFVSGVPLYILTITLRNIDLNFILIVLITFTLYIILILSLIKIKPILFLGYDGAKLLKSILIRFKLEKYYYINISK
ncbi:lipopolysaccharide biosynthesis protein [Alkalicoccobacillus porphyridii]|uniref:lipopolysaccharide biosynthesis protein n=1 Tax=Alkalicoccobacillus porphyridii TaxID=2597270 RepID=UPI00163DD9AD|nr:lipopolysaccharide biosynthesis protein [Alkalicoccobacillus porphyridii]